MIAILVAAAMATASLPDPVLTPGAVASTNPAEICHHHPSYSRTHRIWHDKPGTLFKYHIPPDQARLFEDDDRVPVCLGGDNSSPLNHWAQPWAEAHVKDHLEARACRLVCAGLLPLPVAQGWFLGDWRVYLGE